MRDRFRLDARCCTLAASGITLAAMLAVPAAGAGTVAPGEAERSWLRRSSAPQVVFATNFPSERSVTDHIHGEVTAYNRWDTAIRASGRGSYRVEIAPLTTPNATRAWRINWAERLDQMVPDASRIVAGRASGQSLFVQWRQRFSPWMITHRFRTTKGNGGWKQIIIGQGDVPGEREANSCTMLELAVTNNNQYGMPSLYHSCGRYQGMAERFASACNSRDFKLQNAIDRGPQRLGDDCLNDKARYSLRSGQRGRFRNDGTPEQPDGSAIYHADEWMTFQVEVSPGPYVEGAPFHNSADPTNGFYPSTVRLWVARENEPSVLAIERTDVVLRFRDGRDGPGNTSHVATYGKLWLLAHHTGKDPQEAHPTSYTWYDELIVSGARIADP